MEHIKEKTASQNSFFENLYKGVNDGFLELRPFKNSKPNQSVFIPVLELPNKLQSELEKLTAPCDVYFGVSVRKTNSNGKKENCLFLPALYVDIDYGAVGHKKGSLFTSKEKALQHLHSLNLNPSVIIESGHGLHVYWLLSEPLLLNHDSISKSESIMKTLQFISGGDSTKDVSRILRVPYTKNFKTLPESLAEIVYADYECRYTPNQMENMLHDKGFDKIAKSLSRSEELKRWIFSVTDEPIDDRSRFDQKIITKLVADGFTEDEICTVFNYFPTSGKYLERKDNDESGAEQYLNHSIKNATEYLNDKNFIERNKIAGLINIKPLSENRSNSINLRSYSTGICEISDDCSDASEINENYNHLLADNTVDFYSYQYSTSECGYYVKQRNKSGEVYLKRLTNFVIDFNQQISATCENLPITYFNGKIIFGDREPVEFEHMSASLLASTQKFSEYLHELCGVKVNIAGSLRQITEAIKVHNTNISMLTAVDFGFNQSLTEYRTEDVIISADEIVNCTSPILYSNEWKKNKVGFKTESDYSLDELRKIIIERLLRWDEYKVTLSGFAFTMLSVIYPFLKSYIEGRPYILFTGDSGTGKTTLCRFFQYFFGDFKILYPATSTHTAINVAGHSMKDVLFCIDDLKLTALNSDSKKSNFMSMVQNYSDCNSRNRSNVSLKIREEKEIRGLLMLNGEDIIMTEASTVAREIIMYLAKKDPKMSEARYLTDASRHFSFYTLHFIQHLLKIRDTIDFKNMIAKNVDVVKELSNELKLDGENLPRIINNLALLKSGWDLSKEFLFTVLEPSAKEDFDKIFINGLREILLENFNRAHHMKADEKFEEILLSLLDNGSVIIDDAESNFESQGTNWIGYYKKDSKGNIKVGINLQVAYKIINDHLRNEGGLGIQFESLKNRLIQNGKIQLTNSKMVTLGKKQMRGVYWIGEIPDSVLGIKDPPENPESKEEISSFPSFNENINEDNFLFN